MKHRKALFLACAKGDAEAVQKYVAENRELLNIREPTKGAAPLHFAVIANHVKVVRLLVKLGCDINAVTHAGDSALHLAIMKDHNKLAKVLIKHNVDVLIRNKHGKTAFQLLKRKREGAVRPTPPATAGPSSAGPSGDGTDMEGEGEGECEYEYVVEEGEAEEADVDVDAFAAQLEHRYDSIAAQPLRPRANHTPTLASTVHAGDDHHEMPPSGEAFAPFPTTSREDAPLDSINALRHRLFSRMRSFAPRQAPAVVAGSKPVVMKVMLADNSQKAIRVEDSFTGQNLIDTVCDKIAVPGSSALREEDMDMFELVMIDNPVSCQITQFVDADRTVKDHAFAPTDILTLRTKFFKFPAGDVPFVVLLQLYLQTRSDVLRGDLEVPEPVAVQLGAWTMHYLFGPFDPRKHNLGFISAGELPVYLPKRLQTRYSVEVWQERFFAQYRLHPPGIAAQSPDALWAYLAVARTQPTFGTTMFLAKTAAGKRAKIGVCEDGVVVSEMGSKWAFYSFYRRAPKTDDMELKSWRWDKAAGSVVFEVTREGSPKLVPLTYKVDRGADAARECVELISGYYILLVYGDCLPTRPLLTLADLPVPVEPLPLRTRMRLPEVRAKDRGRQSRLEMLLEDYVSGSLAVNVPVLPALLAPIHEAMDFGRPLTRLSLKGQPFTGRQIDLLVTAISHAGSFKDAPLDLLDAPLTIDISGVRFGGTPELIAAVDSLLAATGRALGGVVEVNLTDCGLTENAIEMVSMGLGACRPLNTVVLSGNPIAEGSVKRLVSAMFQDGHSLQRIELAGCGLTNEALYMFAARLLTDRSPVTAFVVAGNPFTELLETLVNPLGNTQSLRVLDVSDCGQVSAKAMRSLLDFIAGDQQLRAISLRGMRIGSKDCEIFARRIGTNTLISLDLTGNTLGKGIAVIGQALSQASAVSKLALANTGLEKSGIEALATTLPSSIFLKELDLSGNGMSSQAGASLIAALSASTHLETLSFAGNGLKKDFAVAFVTALSANRSIQTVNLSDNKLGADGAGDLAAAIERSRCTFKSLDLSSNKIGAGALAIAAALESNTTLTSLNLADNSIGRPHFDRLLRALETNTALRTLDLRANLKFTEAGRYEVLEPLESGCDVLVTVEG